MRARSPLPPSITSISSAQVEGQSCGQTDERVSDGIAPPWQIRPARATPGDGSTNVFWSGIIVTGWATRAEETRTWQA